MDPFDAEFFDSSCTSRGAPHKIKTLHSELIFRIVLHFFHQGEADAQKWEGGGLLSVYSALTIHLVACLVVSGHDKFQECELWVLFYIHFH